MSATLSTMNLLEGQTEDLPLAEFRARIGDVIAQVQMGKVFRLTKQGKVVAVLAKPEPSALELAAACRALEREETDRIMGIVRGLEGWHMFGFADLGEIHYVRNGVSLCGRWAYTHGGDVFQPHLADRSTCGECRDALGKSGVFTKER